MRQLLLLGGGHAHIEVVRRWSESPLPDVQLTVVDPNPHPVYSGMVPGFVAGEYESQDLEVDLAKLCRAAGARYVQDRAKRVDAPGHSVECESGSPLAYDVASIDIGSTVSGQSCPGVPENVLPSRPIPVLIDSIGALVERARQHTKEREGAVFSVHVVGGGAGGVELAFCLEARLRAAGARPELTLVTSDERLLGSAAPALSRAVARAAHRRGIHSHYGVRVAAVERGALQLEDGTRLESDATLWVTGAAAHPLATNSGLPVDANGFIETTPRLQVAGHDELFAVGDCASLPGAKRAGVYAVRSAPFLDHNLRAQLCGTALREYRPQRDFLSLLNLGDGTAIGAKWGVCLSGRLVHRLKDRIDRSFVALYRR